MNTIDTQLPKCCDGRPPLRRNAVATSIAIIAILTVIAVAADAIAARAADNPAYADPAEPGLPPMERPSPIPRIITEFSMRNPGLSFTPRNTFI